MKIKVVLVRLLFLIPISRAHTRAQVVSKQQDVAKLACVLSKIAPLLGGEGHESRKLQVKATPKVAGERFVDVS